MQLIKADYIINNLKKFDAFFSSEKLQCFIKEEENYKIYIFTMQIKEVEELLKIKDDFRDYLAIYFQSQTLEKDIERWNIYQVFFIEESIRKDIKQQVEQDKFATRKLVFDNLGCILNDELIDEKINSEIFEFKLTKNESASISLIDSLKQDDAILFSEIEKANGNINILLKSLENE